MKRSSITALLLATSLGIVIASLFSLNVVACLLVANIAAMLPHPKNALGLINTNNIAAQQAYDHAKSMLFNAWVKSFKGDANACMDWVEDRKLSQSEIRLEVELNTANSIFTFGVNPTQVNSTGVLFNTENRLQLQDSLIINEYGIFVSQPISRTDTTFLLETYGSSIIFSAADAIQLNSTFFTNGFFTTKVNNDVLVPYRGLLNHLYKPQTQQTAALAANSPSNQVRGAEDGFVTQNPNLLLIGSKNYVPQIVLPAAMTSAAAFMRCTLIYRGILAQNSTVIN